MSEVTYKLPRSIYYRSIAMFIILFLLGGWVNYIDSLQYLEKQKKVALQVANTEVSTLSQILNASISLTYTLEILLKENGFKIDQEGLERFAPQLLQHQPAVSSLQYAPGGIISFIDPLEGNEAAIGHNLLEDPKRNKEAFDAVKMKTLTISGPFELVQGGVAIVARLPIFKSEGHESVFWGFSTVLIRIEDLINSSTIKRLSSQGYEWNIHRIHPDTKSPHVFYGTTDEIIADAVQLKLNVPNAQWFINLKPVDGWLSGFYIHIIVNLCFWLIIAVVFSRFFLFYQKHPFSLKKQIELRTIELLEAKNILEISENRLRQIAENEEMWIWEVDAKGLYTYCSRTCEQFFGYSADEIIGKKHFYDLFYPEDRDELKTAYFEVFKRKKTFKEFQNKSIDRVGSIVWLSASGVPMVDVNGNLLGYRGADVNVTKQVEAEESRRSMEGHAIRAAQLAALGELSAGVAHEVNNPIGGVINYAQIILNKAGKDSTEEKLSKRIIKEGERIATIVSQLLSFSRKEEGEHRFHDIQSIIDVPLSLIGKKLEHDGIIVDICIDENISQVKCNAQQIEQVLLNLLSNAHYALSKKNTQTAEEKKIQIKVKRAMIKEVPFMLLEVKDSGVGIPKDVLPEILNSFYTTKEAGDGTGLGLSISENIINLHNGEIDIDSVEGEYTKVIISLPM